MNPDLEEDRSYWEAILQRANTFKLENFLFDKQLAFVQDPSPFKTAVCSRRAGKTVSCAAHLTETAITTPEIICLYITLSRNNAKKIVWKELQKINRTYALEGKEDATELSITYPNGSIIYLSGAKDTSQIEKFRGLPIKLCYIDECQSFKEYLSDLIDDIISPALMDYAGTLCLIGTPRAVPSGYFYQCSVGLDTWSKHAWTFFDNPFISQKSGLSPRALLDRELQRRGVEVSDPSIQREFFGKWVLDLDSLLLRYDSNKNHYDSLPSANWEYIMGIDLGYEDADAIAVLAWSGDSSETYLVDELVVRKQGLTELVQSTQFLASKYPVSKMVIDEGGLGKKIAEEIRRRHALPVQPADKARKMENIAFLNDALRTGRFKAKKNSRFAQDSMLLEIDRDKSTPDRIRVKDTFHSDIIDAVLYAFKESPAYTYTPPIIKPKLGTPAWAEAEADEMFNRALERIQSQKEDDSMGFGW